MTVHSRPDRPYHSRVAPVSALPTSDSITVISATLVTPFPTFEDTRGPGSPGGVGRSTSRTVRPPPRKNVSSLVKMHMPKRCTNLQVSGRAERRSTDRMCVAKKSYLNLHDSTASLPSSIVAGSSRIVGSFTTHRSLRIGGSFTNRRSSIVHHRRGKFTAHGRRASRRHRAP